MTDDDQLEDRQASARASGGRDRRWLAVAAAAIVVAAGVAAIAWPRGGGDPDPVATETVITSRPSSTGVVSVATEPPTEPTTPTATDTASVPGGEPGPCITQPDNAAGCATTTTEPATDGEASCEADPLTPPSLVDGTQPGDAVIEDQEDRRVARWGTNDSPFAVSQTLGFPIDTSWIDDAIDAGRAITAGDWQATTIAVGDPPISAIAIYLRNTAVGCVRAYFVGPGLYSDQAETLAENWVIALSTGEAIAPVGHGDIGFGYFGRRIVPFEAPFFEIEEFSGTGAVVGTLPDERVASLLSGASLSDGTNVRLDGNRSPYRCVNQPLVRSGATAADISTSALSEARSIAVTARGTLLATRDVCPPGTKWGDSNTFGELVELDPTSENPAVVSLHTWQSDPGRIVLDDGNRVIAFGERTLGDVSPDGRYIALREQYASDAGRWNLLDLRNDATPVFPASVCENAGDIVGPPRFVNNNVVVIARLCATLHTVDDSQGGDVQIEAVDLAAPRPGDSIVWNSSVPGLGVDDFTRSVDLSARQHADDTISVIVSGNGGLETSSQTYALQGDESVDITRLGYQTFAFHAVDLITEFDAAPA